MRQKGFASGSAQSFAALRNAVPFAQFQVPDSIPSILAQVKGKGKGSDSEAEAATCQAAAHDDGKSSEE